MTLQVHSAVEVPVFGDTLLEKAVLCECVSMKWDIQSLCVTRLSHSHSEYVYYLFK